MTALGIVLAYTAIALLSAKWMWNWKAKDYYNRFIFKPKTCKDGSKHFKSLGNYCSCPMTQSARQAKEKAVHWLWLGVVWPVIPIVLFFFSPMKFEKEIEAQKQRDEELKKLKELAKANGLEWPA